MERNFRWKLISLITLIALSTWALWPSFQLYSMPPAERYATGDPALRELRGKALKLGLDLLGGMHMVLQLDDSKLRPEEVPDAMDRVMQILRNRVDQFGVAEPIVQQQGADRILVQLPGLLEKDRAADLIGRTAQLEFRLVKTPADSRQVIERLDRAILLASKGSAADSLTVDSLATRPLIDLLTNFPDFSIWGGAEVEASDVPAVERALRSVNLETVLPRDASVMLGHKDVALGGGIVGRVLFVLNRQSNLSGDGIKTARMQVGIDPTRPSEPGVSMDMNAKGTTAFRKVTGDNVGRQLAIVLDDRVVSAPVIRDRIPQGRATISGSFTDSEAKDLGIILRAGALPAPVNIVEERTVGPSLGRDSIDAGLRAGWIGAVAVLLFMLLYYRFSGLIAVIGLSLNLFFLFAGLAAFKSTLTLPGIAGIALTVGMAIDANVLIFERIREELRSGKRVRKAIDAGYSRAFTTILDSNLTTLISAVVLFWFGSGPIKGFAVTLGIGILANLFTATTITKLIYDLMYAKREPATLSI